LISTWTKSRRIFYTQVDRQSFHTAWVNRNRVEPTADPAVSAMKRSRAKKGKAGFLRCKGSSQ
jgi:hypothetical protein